MSITQLGDFQKWLKGRIAESKDMVEFQEKRLAEDGLSLFITQNKNYLDFKMGQLKASKYIVKFQIYAHNGDIAKMKKYLQKFKEIEVENLEKYNEILDDGLEVNLSTIKDGTNMKIFSKENTNCYTENEGEGGYIKFADTIKNNINHYTEQSLNAEFLHSNPTGKFWEFKLWKQLNY